MMLIRIMCNNDTTLLLDKQSGCTLNVTKYNERWRNENVMDNNLEQCLARIEAKLDVLIGACVQSKLPSQEGDVVKTALSFTPKQHAVMQMVWHNNSTEYMAEAMDVSISTIKVHIRGIMKKTGYKTRAQIAMLADEMMSIPEEAYRRQSGIPRDWCENMLAYPEVTNMLREKVR